ncbi:MAG: hypothetical protein GY799_26410 [Desulfobulbaceae bacterium]|nr:hypothetical protein [Desulfobulbaceae bacterium]
MPQMFIKSYHLYLGWTLYYMKFKIDGVVKTLHPKSTLIYLTPIYAKYFSLTYYLSEIITTMTPTLAGVGSGSFPPKYHSRNMLSVVAINILP